MGTVQSGDDKKNGLFGYKKGARTIFLDATNGSATFGQAGTGQIKIDAESGIITGGSYSTKKGSGMEINLGENPSITFGSKKFYVTPAG
jgi:hypothetical protein